MSLTPLVPILSPPGLFYIVKSIVDPKAEREWDEWHSNSHIPDVLKQPGFLKATKLRRSGLSIEEPEYWTIYEITGLEAFQQYDASDSARKLREEHKEKFGSSTKLERIVLVKTFEAISHRSEFSSD